MIYSLRTAVPILLLSALTFFAAVHAAYAATYYVDATGGNDSNDGLTTGTAWQTVANINSTTFSAGDSVLFKRGETATGTVTLYDDSGTAGNPITFGAYGTGADPLLNSAGQSRSFDIRNSASYITIEHMRLAGASEAAIYILTGTFSNLVFSDLDIASSSAFKLFSGTPGTTTNSTFSNITIHDANRGVDHRGTSIGDTYENITITGPVDYGIVYTITTGTSTVFMRTVSISNTTLDAIRLKNIASSTFDDLSIANAGDRGLYFQQNVRTATITNAMVASSSSYGIQFAGTTTDVLVEDTTTTRNGIDGIAFALKQNENITIRNASSSQNGSSGIQMRGSYGSTFLVEDSTLDRNTLNGLTIYDDATVVIRRTTAAYNENDGFNIRNEARADFIQCTARENGVDGSGADGDGYSWHDGSTGSLVRSIAMDNKKSAVTNIATTSVEIYSNIFSHTSSGTLPMVYMAGSAQSVTYNNTFVNLSHEGTAIGRNTTASSTIVNNLVYGFASGIEASSSYDTLAHNYVYGAPVAFLGFVPDVNSSSTTDPALVDVANGNYRPTSGSPIARAGSIIRCPVYDYDGVPFSIPCDVGAFTVDVAVAVTGGGGALLNPTGGGRSGKKSDNALTSTTTADAEPADTTSTMTVATGAPCALGSGGKSGSDVYLTPFVQLLFTAGIIPADKQTEACEALRNLTMNAEAQTTAGEEAPFAISLRKGDRSAEVRRLQQFLNAHGFVLTTDGLGSPGNETNLFGLLTEDAVKRFQAAYATEILVPVGLTAPSGFWGPSSIRKANALLSGA